MVAPMEVLRNAERGRVSFYSGIDAGLTEVPTCELPRIPKRRSSQNDLKANFAEINFYEVRAY
jgi:hypothetical protein